MTANTFTCSLTRITQGFDEKTCWVQARGGVIPPASPGAMPVAVVTMQKLLLTGSDIFSGLSESRSSDGGQTWSPVSEVKSLGRWTEPNGVEAVICDGTPRWHAKTGRLLLTGHIARYIGDELMPEPRPRQTSYAVLDPATNQWSAPGLLQTPDDADQYFSLGSGSGERVDLPDGDILMPVYYKPKDPAVKRYNAAIVRCAFDGKKLSFLKIGSSHSITVGRGLYEPSIAQYAGRFFMTLRNDEAGYVNASDDGLNFSEAKPWTFDDGQPLGNYNTQQHWLTRPDGLYLVYTRRGLNNDHIFRHRAPIVIAKVDPEKCVIIRETERIVIPERGARLGNFSVLSFSPNEDWVIAAEWMQNSGRQPSYMRCTPYGSDNSVFVARLKW